MMVRYWSPFQEMETLRRQLDQAFNDVTSAVEPTSSAQWHPAIRLVESGDSYMLTVHLPGVEPHDIDVQVTREAVEVKGDRRQPDIAEGDRVLYDNTRYGSFRRLISLPEPVRNDAASADFRDGKLVLTLPKVEEVRNKVVKISLTPNVEDRETPAIATETSATGVEPGA